MQINHWLSSPYMMEASAKTPSSTLTPISTATFWATTASPCSQGAAAFAFNLNNEDEGEQAAMDYTQAHATKEPLFEKPLTPSDVGKLNRLVIPKQHAEKYFPMNGGGGGDSGEKGLLLGFEDEMGQPWRFRYSYWNSSQSYVLTKGWSRYVKEKRLDAGDIVLFARHPKEVGRFFIGWRRMSSGGGGQDGCVAQPPCSGGWSGYSGYSYPNHHQLSTTSAFPHTECSHAENHTRGIVRTGNSKRLRLFGVNLECDEDESEPVTPKDSTNVSSQTLVHEDPYHGYYSSRHTISYMLDSTNT